MHLFAEQRYDTTESEDDEACISLEQRTALEPTWTHWSRGILKLTSREHFEIFVFGMYITVGSMGADVLCILILSARICSGTWLPRLSPHAVGS